MVFITKYNTSSTHSILNGKYRLANMFISSQVIQENVVLAAILNFFPSEPEVDFENQEFIHVHAI